MATRGRPRTFSREQALERAMELFWASGYEAVTLSDLQQAMGGITAPSFYAAFGSKEQLFREATELYQQTQGAAVLRAFAEGATARKAIEGLLRAAANAVCQRGRPRGCLQVLGAVNCMLGNSTVENFLREQRAGRPRLLRQRLERGVAEGDVPPGADLAALASFYITVVDGMALQARDGASRKTLQLVVNAAMAAWDPMVSGNET